MRSAIADAAVVNGVPPVVLCTLTLPDGRAIRVATRPVEVDPSFLGRDGPYAYHPFLAGVSDFEEELDYFAMAGSAALSQATVDIVTDEDLAALQGDWYAVTAGTMELALFWEGMAWEERVVILGGARIQNIEFGVLGQVTSFSVEAGPVPTSANVGDDTRDLGVDWPDPLLDNGGIDEMSSVVGSKYQWVYGDPESVLSYKVGNVGGNNRCVIAGHKFARTGASYQIRVTEYDDDGNVVITANYTVSNGTTPVLGDPYAYVESATEFASGVSKGAYTYSAVYGGIASAIDVTAPALGAREILRRLLVDTGLPIDWRRMEPALASLGGWRIGFYADKECSAIDTIRDLLTVLPLLEVNSGSGLWFAFSAPDLAPIEAHLILGQELLGRTTRMATTDLEQVVNSFTLNYWRSAATLQFEQSVSLGAEGSALCALSQQLYGVREADVQEAVCIWDEPTALRVLHHKATRFALPRRVLEYQASPDLYWLEAGMVILLTDPDYGIDAHRGVVSVVSRSSNPMTIKIELVDRTATSRD